MVYGASVTRGGHIDFSPRDEEDDAPDPDDDTPETPLDEPRPPRVEDPPPEPDEKGPYVVSAWRHSTINGGLR